MSNNESRKDYKIYIDSSFNIQGFEKNNYSFAISSKDITGTFKKNEYMAALISGYSNDQIKDLAVSNIKKHTSEIAEMLSEIEKIKANIKSKRADIRLAKRYYKDIAGVKYE